ncbi:MAG: O-methyltransferase [Bacteroidales bacterium]|nr:O-methyltransferase [Bacteroidales bacterium]
MSTLNNAVEKFCNDNSSPINDVLNEIYRDTWVNVLYPQMLTNELQGRLLSMLSNVAKPKKILEIGTFTAYATVCLASGLSDDGKIFTIEKNEELEERILNNLKKANIIEKTELIIGDAKEILFDKLSEFKNAFDIIYIDADKENYPKYLDFAYDMLKPSGILLADNVFWGGKVFQKEMKHTKESIGIKNFLENVPKYKWNSRTIIPIGDGLFCGIKIF